MHHTHHTVDTLMLANGFEVTIVAQILGDTPEVVQKTYAHLVAGRDKKASEAMGEIMGKSQLRPGCAPDPQKPVPTKTKKPRKP